jgi:hypothetical protein
MLPSNSLKFPFHSGENTSIEGFYPLKIAKSYLIARGLFEAYYYKV